MTALRERPAWQDLERHFSQLRDTHLRELFAADPARGERLIAEAAGLYLDFSKNRVTDETMMLLGRLALECGVPERREAMFAGERINVSENRPVLHVALRMPRNRSLLLDGVDVVKQVHEVLRPDGRLRRAGSLRRVERPQRSSDPQRRQRRHRRLRPRPGDGL